jgi:uncharacterized protein DUF6527
VSDAREQLVDLAPHWIGYGTILIGVSFLCPHCRTQRLAILFKNAIDPEGWLSKGVTRHHDPNEWERTGDTFETLTLRPSIDTAFHGHWHGFVTNGIVDGHPYV